MSTSDPLQHAPLSEPASFAGSPPVASAPALPFDSAALTRMANEFFTALPDSYSDSARQPAFALPFADSGGVSALASVPATPPAFTPELSLPSDPHLPGIPASAGPASISPVTAPIQATPPALPGAVANTIPAQVSSGLPAFSFLQDARPIFADTNTNPAPSYPPAKPITGFTQPSVLGATAIPVFDSAFTPTLPAGLAESLNPPAPALPASFSPSDSSAFPAFSFLEDARPLFSYPPSAPGPVPAQPAFGFLDARAVASPEAPSVPAAATIEPNVPKDLALSSYEFDAATLKRDFPILRERVNGRPLVWLDNAATTQKPQSVIDRLKYFYEHENSNVHRAAHELAARATDAYESAREKVRRFLNASSSREIIFVRGATEGINLIAQTWGWQNILKDDEIVITWLEHHANIVPWQMLAAEKGAKLRVAPVDDSGQILLNEYEKLLGAKTRLVALPQVSNALGVIPPVQEMIAAAHRHGAKVLLDGAQSVSHIRVDVQSLDCDFFVFSGHKVFAPTGIGVVYGKPEILEHMQPWQGGGNMIQDVTFEKTLYQPPPQRFEAGTGNIADAVGLGAAIDYLDRAGMENISRHEHELLIYATAALQQIPGLRIIGTAKEKAGVISFVMDGFRTEEVGDYLNRNGIAVRSGHHCAQPILRRFGLESTVRASLALYNTLEDIDALVTALWNLRLGRTAIA
jgi:cysteine desulfurase / selenocysteine lyase